MGKPTGFMEFPRQAAPYRPAKERLLDFSEIYTSHDVQRLSTQSARCMDCGVPFCQSEEGCPIHNLIPEFNDLVFRDEWKEALDRLQKPTISQNLQVESAQRLVKVPACLALPIQLSPSKILRWPLSTGALRKAG